jgi:hypothetical protein
MPPRYGRTRVPCCGDIANSLVAHPANVRIGLLVGEEPLLLKIPIRRVVHDDELPTGVRLPCDGLYGISNKVFVIVTNWRYYTHQRDIVLDYRVRRILS